MKNEKSQIEAQIGQITSDLGFFLIDIDIRGVKNQQVIEVYIDNEKGITTEDCSNVSRHIHDFLDTSSSEELNYRLDVSSPGVSRPLKFLQQYKKHLKRKFSVKFELENESKKMEGELIDINGEKLTFKRGKEEFVIPFEKIKEAKVLISLW